MEGARRLAIALWSYNIYAEVFDYESINNIVDLNHSMNDGEETGAGGKYGANNW